jgi:threonyl-tRNA synthetase
VFWHPKGWTIIQTLVRYMRAKVLDAGYEEVNTPDMMDRSLWEASGHWEAFGENMFTTDTDQDRTLAMKPMNCPGAVQIFNNRLRSYRELPLRLAEFGKVHRFEPSGALLGLMRVRSFVQDDGHIFCTEDQITEESKRFCTLVQEVYRDLGFERCSHQVRRPARKPGRRGQCLGYGGTGSGRGGHRHRTGVHAEPGGRGVLWPKAGIRAARRHRPGLAVRHLQVDLNLPARLGAYYIGEDSDKHMPVLLHRAVLGSFERFLGILLEHHAGALPLWLAPVQDYAREVRDLLRARGLRADIDLRNEKIGYKVREHSVAKVPVILAVGRQEVAARTVALRRLGEKGQRTLELEKALEILGEEAGRTGAAAATTAAPAPVPA